MDNPIKMDDLGVPYFRKPPYGGFRTRDTHGASPFHHPYILAQIVDWDFPRKKASILWGSPVYGNLQKKPKIVISGKQFE